MGEQGFILSDYSTAIEEQIRDSINVKKALADDVKQIEIIARISDAIASCYRSGNKVILMGNGGSAADAQHIAGELVGKFQMERKALPAIALNVNTSILTAVGNDYDFDRVFIRQVDAFANPGDVVIGISTSGNSSNVIIAVERAKEKGSFIVAFTGEQGGKLATVADICLKAPSNSTPRIQETHITAGHIICGIVERVLFG
jgi:D-sedoheptulose 7-phosphate isomerase